MGMRKGLCGGLKVSWGMVAVLFELRKKPF